MQTVHNIATKVNARSEAKNTELTIDWENMNEDELRELARQTIVIKVQAAWRRAETIPETATIKAHDYRVGARNSAPQPTVEEMLARLSPEELAHVMSRFGGRLVPSAN